MHYSSFLFLLSFLTLTACGGTKANQPELGPCNPRVQAQPGSKIFKGFIEGPNKAETRQAAMVRTLGEALQPLGVQISSELTTADMVADGVDSSSITLKEKVSLKPIQVRDLKVGYCYDGKISAVRAAVAITDGEWKRLKRVYRGGTLLVLDCKTKPEMECEDDLFDALSKAAADAGLKVTSSIEAPKGVRKGSARALIALGEEEDAAQILWVSLKAKFKGEFDDVLYAYASASASLVETSDGQIEKSANREEIKGAHYAELEGIKYGPETVLNLSMKKAIAELHEEMRGWK